MKKLYYLSCPYNDSNTELSHLRLEAANKATAELLKAGKIVFSPLTHNVTLLKYGLPTGWEFWGPLDEALIQRCDKLLVLKIDGWDKSSGVAKEMAIAESLGKPIEFIDPF